MGDLDVVVIGAGLSGLRAADRLAARGASVVVLEARDRVGGRLLSERVGAATFDVGGQWIGPHQARAWALTRELGLATFETFDHGEKVLFLGGRARRYRGTIPRLDPLSLVELQATLTRIERARRRVRMDRPDLTPGARARDGDTLGAWQDRHVRSRAVRQIMDAAMRVVFGVEARELSMLTLLHYAHGGEGLMKLVEIRDGAQQTRFVDGAQGLALGLAERLDVRLGCPVRSVDADEAGVTVRHDGPDGPAELRADRCVVAVPPALSRRIHVTPTLPAAKRQALARTPTGATTKHLLTYDHAFWRDDGLSGEVVAGDGPFSVAFDNTSADGAQPALLAFAVAQPARDASDLDPAARRRAVRRRLAACLGPEAARPTEHRELEWAREPWSRGCPVGLAMTGTHSELGPALREPVGRIHWAGTETALAHPGFIEGALEAADRVAEEIEALG